MDAQRVSESKQDIAEDDLDTFICTDTIRTDVTVTEFSKCDAQEAEEPATVCDEELEEGKLNVHNLF